MAKSVDVVAVHVLKAGGDYHPPGRTVTIESMEEAQHLIAQGAARWPAADDSPAPAPDPEDVDLPEEFPGRGQLIEAGILSLDAVREVGDLTSISGIGAKTAADIQEALEASNDPEEGADDDSDEGGDNGQGDDDGTAPKEPGEPGVDAVEA